MEDLRDRIRELERALRKIVALYDEQARSMAERVEEQGVWAEGVFEGRGQAADIAREAL